MHFFSRMLTHLRTILNVRRPTVRRRHPLTHLLLELLEDQNLLHANIVLDADHLAVIAFPDLVTQVTRGRVPNSRVTSKSIAGCNWTDPSIWSNGVPRNSDTVLITSGTIVTINGNARTDPCSNFGTLRTIRDDGASRFDSIRDKSVLADTITVAPTGTSDMGTESTPFDAIRQARVIFADLETGLHAADQATFEAARRAWDLLKFSVGSGVVAHYLRLIAETSTGVSTANFIFIFSTSGSRPHANFLN